MKRLHFIPSFLRNKYILAAIAFAVWMVFFDRDDLLVQNERRRQLRDLQTSKTYFAAEIKRESTFSENLRINPVTIEKFAREKYLMKREGEDLFIIQPAGKEEK
jgi:cell division protein FtsB